MPTLADSLVSSSSRKLPVRMRPDLQARRGRYQGRDYWVVKDPVGLHYYRFEEEEYAILSMLDGGLSLDDLKTRFEAEFPPQKISLAELQQFLGLLHRSSLVIADAAGQGDQLKKRHDERRRTELVDRLTNILAIRFKGFDPEPALEWLYPRVRWLFSLPSMLIACLLILAAVTLLTVQFDAFSAKLPAFHEFFAAKNWILLAVALAVTKVVHEFAHALACKHYGGECHEMGVLVLVLTPCLYCNVSDAWMLPNKWHRAAIGAAGMFVELVIAAICTFLWWFSEPGLLNYLCLSTMFVCSVSTLLMNANPLLRFDGYYILSDLVEIPNLRQKASTLLHRKLAAWCLGLKETADPFLPKRNQGLFALYSVAAAVYRWLITFSILWFLYKVFEPYRLEILGQMIALVALYGLVGRPLWQVFKFFHVPGRIYKVNQTRMRTTLGCLAAAAVAIVFLPLPSAIYCPLELEPHGATPVYVDIPGRLEEIHVAPGQQVVAGDVLGRLSNLDVHLATAQLQGERNKYQTQLANLQRQQFSDPDAALGKTQVVESLTYVKQQLRQKQHDLARLELTAPVSGTILPPPAVPAQDEAQGELASWSGTPLQTRNLGADLRESTIFCHVGDPLAMQAILVIDQADVERVREGLPVEILLDQLPGETYRGRIEEVATIDLKVTSSRLSGKHGGQLATTTDASGRERPMNTSYQARVPLDDLEGILRIGLRGQAKIHTQWEPLGSRFWRYLARTFNFEL